MKNTEPSKNSAVKNEQELIYHFCELIRQDPDLDWSAFQQWHDKSAHVSLQLDSRRLEYEVAFKLKPSIPDLERTCLKNNKQNTLLVAPSLSNRVIQFCKESKLSCIDLNGRAWIRAEGILVDRGALLGRSFGYQLEPQKVFAGKSVRMVRSLLTERDRVWTQAELVKRTHLSSGMVSRLMNHFVSQSYLEKLSPREYQIRDFDGLLEEWNDADGINARCTTSFYAGPVGGFASVAQSLQNWSEQEEVGIAFTQWFAAYERHPYTEPVVCSAYVEHLPDVQTLEAMGLRQVWEGGKVWLHVPKENGLFLETQKCGELTLATDSQIYIDLKNTRLRGPEGAQALREWKGFCRNEV